MKKYCIDFQVSLSQDMPEFPDTEDGQIARDNWMDDKYTETFNKLKDLKITNGSIWVNFLDQYIASWSGTS